MKHKNVVCVTASHDYLAKNLLSYMYFNAKDDETVHNLANKYTDICYIVEELYFIKGIMDGEL